VGEARAPGDLVADITERTGISRWVLLGRIALKNYQRSQLTRMAAALSYRTLFGLVPVLVVGLVVLHSFVDESRLRATVAAVLEYTGIARIAVDEAEPLPTKDNASDAAPPMTFWGPPVPMDAAAEPREPTAGEPVSKSARLDTFLTGLLDRIDGINFGAVGLVGVVLLIYAALAMIVEVEKAFNQIVGVESGKNWVRRVRDYWALLTLGPLLLVMSFSVREGAKELAQRWAEPAVVAAAEPRAPRAEQPASEIARAGAGARSPGVRTGWRGSLLSGVAFVSTVIISTLALVILFTTVPNTRVGVLQALAGAVLSAVLWETSKWAFTAYAGRSYTRLYGALALLPLFMLWVYVTWNIVLLGFQVCCILQTYRSVTGEGVKQSVLIALGLADDPAEGRRGFALVDPAAVLLVMCVVAEGFAAGKTTARSAIGEATGLEEGVVGELLSRLVAMNLLLRVALGKPEEDDANEAYTLARPAETIPAVEVLRAGESASARDPRRPSAVLDAISQAKARALEGRTLADLRVGIGRGAALESGSG
jgi:membrane protein